MVTSKFLICGTGNSVSTFFFLTTATFGLDWDWLVDSSIFTGSRQNSKNAHPSSLPWLFSNLGTAVKRSNYGKEIILDYMSGSGLITWALKMKGFLRLEWERRGSRREMGKSVLS